MVVVSECFFVLSESCGESSSSLSDQTLLHSGQVSFYTPDCENLSGVGFLWESSFPIVIVVRNAILRSVFLKRLVM